MRGPLPLVRVDLVPRHYAPRDVRQSRYKMPTMQWLRNLRYGIRSCSRSSMRASTAYTVMHGDDFAAAGPCTVPARLP